METIKKSIRITASAASVFNYLTNPINLLEIWPSMVEISNVKTDDKGGHSYDWTYKMAGVRFQGHSYTTDVDRNRKRLVKNDTGIPSTFFWGFEQRDDGAEVTLKVDYELPAQLLGKLAKPFLKRLNEREANSVLENLKERIESQPEEQLGAQGPTVTP